MFDTLTPRSTTGEFKTMPGARPDPGGFLPEARTGAREAAAHMKDLAERFAGLRNAIMCLPGNPSYACGRYCRVLPGNTPACLDHRAREVEEGEEKGDAPKGKESSLRAVSQPHQPEVPDVRSHS